MFVKFYSNIIEARAKQYRQRQNYFRICQIFSWQGKELCAVLETQMQVTIIYEIVHLGF